MSFDCDEFGTDACDPERPPSAGYCGTAEACRLLGVSRRTLYRQLERDAVPGARRVLGRWRFRRADLLRYVEDGAPPRRPLRSRR